MLRLEKRNHIVASPILAVPLILWLFASSPYSSWLVWSFGNLAGGLEVGYYPNRNNPTGSDNRIGTTKMSKALALLTV